MEKQEDGTYIIGDWKTHYGAAFSNIESATKQMSIYRWLFEDEYNIQDTGYALTLSVTNNDKEMAHPLSLMSLDQTQDFIEANLYAIIHNENVDCLDNVKYNPCSYCEFTCIHRQ